MVLKPNFFDFVVNDTYSSGQWAFVNHGLFLLITLLWFLILVQGYELSLGWSTFFYLFIASVFKLMVSGVVSFVAYKINPENTPE